MATKQDGPSRFRTRLLPATLRHAAEIDFYRTYWGITEAVPETLDDVPSVSKREQMADLETIRHHGVDAAVLTHTTGTTGRPFRRYRSRIELDAYYEYVTALLNKARRRGVTDRSVLAFNALPAAVHGTALPGPQIAYRISVDVLSDDGVRNALSLMSDASLFAVDGRRPRRILIGSPDMLLSFTVAADGVDPASLYLDELYSIGDTLTSRTHQALSASWPAPVIDVFSLSEVMGSAPRCEHCDGYHFEPIVWPEILDLDADRPAVGDLGELTLTELHPFSQIQPLIRYRTGDVVERVPCPANPYDLGFRHVGRRDHCPSTTVKGRTTILLTALDLREVLEGEHGVARKPPWGNTHRFVRTIPLGSPRATWTVTQSPRPHLEVVAESLFSPTLYRVEADAMAGRLRLGLLKRARVESVVVTVRVTEPGANVKTGA